jgi:hypothetical protein
MVASCEVALEAAHRLDASLALGFLALQVGACPGVQPASCDRDDVQSAVELAVAATIEAVAIVSAGRDGNRCDGLSASPREVEL